MASLMHIKGCCTISGCLIMWQKGVFARQLKSLLMEY